MERVIKGRRIDFSMVKEVWSFAADRAELRSAPLPGSMVPGVYCGHGQDVSSTSDLQHNWFDWLCGQPYCVCVLAGKAQRGVK